MEGLIFFYFERSEVLWDGRDHTWRGLFSFILREVRFYGMVGIIHGGAYFLGFIVFEKLKC